MQSFRYFFLLLIVLFQFSCRDEEYHNELGLYQFELNKSFANPEESPLEPKDLQKFHKLPFFAVDKGYLIEADFVRTPNEEPFEMVTTTDRRPVYKKFGVAHFELDGKECSLEIYQNQDLIKRPGYEKHLFLPFGDLTNGNESYGGGRFLDLEIPEGNTINIDFNKAYNPLCAYNHKYSCPIPPESNRLNIRIPAGVKAPKNH